MMTFVWIVLALVATIIVLFALLWIRAIGASIKRNQLLDNMIQPALAAVESSVPEAEELIRNLAEDPGTRNYLYFKLKEAGQEQLFPREFRTPAKIAESELVAWLMHPNELGIAPAAIELVREIPVTEGDKTGSYYLFKFRTDPPHWSSNKGWMTGVSGTVWSGDDYEIGPGTFSELTPFDVMTEEQHLDFIEHMRTRKGLVVSS